MSATLINLTSQSDVINDEIEKTTRDIKYSKSNLKIDTISINKLKDALKRAKATQETNSRAYENNEKKFKAIVKYGEILRKIEKLLGLMPISLENLSLEELAEKLEELQNTRKRNAQQLSFIFFQNMLTDLLTNMVNIEKDFQMGSISSKEALGRVREAKSQIKENVALIPPVMQPAVTQASHLVQMYEAGFSQIVEKTNNLAPTPLIETTMSLDHQVIFEELNINTKALLSQVNDLDSNLSKFEPQVNVTKLLDNLEETENVISYDNWTLEDFESSMANLDLTAEMLINEQTEKNRLSENYATQIQESIEKANDLTKTSIAEVSEEVFTEANRRAETLISNVKIVDELKSDDAVTVNFQTEFAETVLLQLDADQTVSDVVAIDPNAETSFKDDELNQEAQESAENLQEKINQQELEQGHIKHFEIEKEVEDEEELKRRLEQLKKEEEDPNNSEY